MPLYLPVDELDIGMRLAEPFMHRGRMMLPAGKTLNAADMDVLHRSYSREFIKIGDPILDGAVQFEDDSYERDVARKAQSKIAKTIHEVGQRISNRTAVTGKDVQMMQTAVVDMMRYLSENPVTAALIFRTMQPGTYLADHSAAVFYLAMTLGTAVKSYVVKERMRQTHAKNLSGSIAFDLVPLGLGAVFMDIGMHDMTHLFTDPAYKLTEDDRRRIREHPSRGASMLPESFPSAGRMIVRTHHENMDGSGYPEGMSGDRQHIFTRIIRLCDSYDAAVSAQVYKQAKTPARAVWEITSGPYARFYDPVLAKIFAGMIQPFPIGAKLRLRDGRYGVVVQYNRKNPFQPFIIIAFDDENRRLDQRDLVGPLDLSRADDYLQIASFGDEELSYIHDIDLKTDDVEVGERFDTLFAAAFP